MMYENYNEEAADSCCTAVGIETETLPLKGNGLFEGSWVDIDFRSSLVKNSKDGSYTGINYDDAAKSIKGKICVAHIAENSNTLAYDRGVYCQDGNKFIEGLIYRGFEGIVNKHGKNVLTSHAVKEIMARVHTHSIVHLSVFERHEPIFNVANGVLDLNTWELKEHSPDWMQLTKSPVIYNPDAQCPRFREFLDQALESKYIPLVAEMVGYILWQAYHIHKAFMLLGPKRTGKGTLLRVIEALIGEADCSHVSLQDLTGTRFYRARLFGKKLNTSGDLPATPINDPGIFKNLTGEDTIDAENKFEQIFSFKNIAKLLYSANSLPWVKGDDDAFYNRWIVISFNNSVFGKEDPDLTAKLTTPDELSGILNFGLEGLKRLKASGWIFTYGDDGAALYRRASNPIYAYLEDRCEPSEYGYTCKSDLLADYNEWAKQHSLPLATSKQAFGSQMKDQVLIPVETCHPMNGGRQVEAWRGIKLKT